MDEYTTVTATTIKGFDEICNIRAKEGYTPCFPIVIMSMKTETNPIHMVATSFIQQWRRPLKK